MLRLSPKLVTRSRVDIVKVIFMAGVIFASLFLIFYRISSEADVFERYVVQLLVLGAILVSSMIVYRLETGHGFLPKKLALQYMRVTLAVILLSLFGLFLVLWVINLGIL